MILNFLSLTGSYSFAGSSGNSFGMGLSVRAGFLQIYAMSDNIIAVLDPSTTEYANARVGVSFLFGRKKSKKTITPTIQ